MYNVPGTALSILDILCYLVLTLELGGRYYYHPRSTDEETEAQGD